MKPDFASIKTAVLIAIGSLTAAAVLASPQQITLAKPTPAQFAFQDLELGVFIHYSIDVYAAPGCPPGGTPASAFNPTELNAQQWVSAAEAMGATYAVLTARHEEGFCLWPTKTTDYSVTSSPFKGGKGDIVREFVGACRNHAIKPDPYNPPRLNHDSNGRSDSIGPVPQGGKCRELYASLARTAHELQPNCLHFGPDVEHVGNEDGRACYPCWNAVTTLDGTEYTISTTYKWNGNNTGDPLGKFYRPSLGSTTAGFSTGGWMGTRPHRRHPSPPQQFGSLALNRSRSRSSCAVWRCTMPQPTRCRNQALNIDN